MNHRNIPWEISSPNVSYLELPIDKYGDLKLRIEIERNKENPSPTDMIRVGIKTGDRFIPLREGYVPLRPFVMNFPIYNHLNKGEYIANSILEPLMDDMDSAFWTAIGVFKGRIPYEEES